MISDKRLEQALIYLSETDQTAAELTANAERMEFKAKAIKDALFLHEEGTVAERAAKAGAHKNYEIAMDAYFAAVQLAQATKNKRQTEALVIDVWRSLQANRRQAA
jgi:hypothetical protein